MTTSARENALPLRRGFGIVGSLPPSLVRILARAAEDAGYASFWANDGAEGEGLAALHEAASATSTIQLAVGAIPLDRVSPERIAARIAELALPAHRLIVGVGSGGQAGGLQRVRDGVAILRQCTSVPLVIAAMGPKMCALAGEIADGVLLDWASPAYAARVSEIVAARAAQAGRPLPWVASYVFTALGPDARARLQQEAAYYAALPAYAAHFTRIGAEPLATIALGDDPLAIQHALRPFSATLDEPVIRAVVSNPTANHYLSLLHAAAPPNR
jgi:alkanesulfonate monooxygenase SsuD/methylene tetrahydromethanopterin reductase-like flavin-dependent oxidoreductase (luciferase family)